MLFLPLALAGLTLRRVGPVTATQSFFDNAMTFTGQDNLQWIHGKHSVTVGFQVIDEQENTAAPEGGGNVADLTSVTPKLPVLTRPLGRRLSTPLNRGG